MKTKFVIPIIAGIAVASVFGALLSFNMIKNYEDQKQLEDFREKRESVLKMLMEKKAISEPSESNFVIIYSTFEHNQHRIYTEPHNLTIYLEQDDTVTWINKADHTAIVYDRKGGTWSTGQIKPSMQKSVQFNKTGFYQYTVDTEIDRHHGEIIAISNETNLLPMEIKSKMAMSMVSGDRDNNPALVGVGIGDPKNVIMIDINQELKKNPTQNRFTIRGIQT